MNQSELDEIKAQLENAVTVEAVETGYSLNGYADGLRYWKVRKKVQTNSFDLMTEDDAKYIETACNALPALVAEVERLRLDNESLQTSFELGKAYADYMKARRSETCYWSENFSSIATIYATSCGKDFVFAVEPEKGLYTFCPSCGKRIEYGGEYA